MGAKAKHWRPPPRRRMRSGSRRTAAAWTGSRVASGGGRSVAESRRWRSSARRNRSRQRTSVEGGESRASDISTPPRTRASSSSRATAEWANREKGRWQRRTRPRSQTKGRSASRPPRTRTPRVVATAACAKTSTVGSRRLQAYVELRTKRSETAPSRSRPPTTTNDESEAVIVCDHRGRGRSPVVSSSLQTPSARSQTSPSASRGEARPKLTIISSPRPVLAAACRSRACDAATHGKPPSRPLTRGHAPPATFRGPSILLTLTPPLGGPSGRTSRTERSSSRRSPCPLLGTPYPPNTTMRHDASLRATTRAVWPQRSRHRSPATGSKRGSK
mmetsp:Transcript_24236/g.75784  ORF Transcript_24236/g.75784 Transcript_24236/m.75784 type:complete len:332 (-) Transcript_24236:27-1022(-)